MSNSFNKIILVGNLGRDPELRYTPQGTPVCSFSMATNERRRDKAGDNVDITTWFRVTLWGRQAETAQQYLTKGRPVYIEGRLRVEEYTDKEGKQRYALEVNATDMQFLGGQNVEGIPVSRGASGSGGGGGGGQYDRGGGGGGGGQQRGGGGGAPDIEDDDIPF